MICLIIRSISPIFCFLLIYLMNQFELMESMLAYWKETDAFQESLKTRSQKMSWKFFDGPPFTSGDPHYGHLLQSAVKDVVPRWMTMRGYHVERKR